MADKINWLRQVGQWCDMVKDANSGFHSQLNEIYGDQTGEKAEAARMCLRTLETFARQYGPNRSVIIARSTGRVNLLGTHIDHRGGSVNPIAVKQMWAVVEPRDDDYVLVKNVESAQFPDEQFRISNCLPKGEKIQNWESWCHDEFEKRTNDPSVTWSNYVRCAVLYFQHLNTKDDGTFAPAIKGMNMMFYGNIPIAAGLSSSSAVVMAAVEAVMHINALEIEPMELIEHCGYAEWYVGTRGGYSDHAAIKFGRPNTILHMTGSPITIENIPLPAGYRIVLADSMVKANKQLGARSDFNKCVAAYVFALLMIRKNFPQYADKLEHLRDVNPARLGVDQVEIYRIVKSLPVSCRRDDVLKLLPEHEKEIRHIFRSHDEPEEGYKIRQICLYGITECIRADMVPECLRTGDMKTFGELMNISHDGDRVTKLVDGRRLPSDNSCSAARIDALISDLESGKPERTAGAALWRQPGGYAASVSEMDMLVDIAIGTPGVVGAGLVGAGTGGSIAAVVEDKYARQLIDNMAEQYYRPRNLPTAAETVTPIGGSCVMDV